MWDLRSCLYPSDAQWGQARDLGSPCPQLASATDSLCDLEQDIPSSVALWSSEDRGEGREMRPFLFLLVRLSPTGHSEAGDNRTNIAAVFLQGSVALLLMVFLWQLVLNLSYSFSYPYFIVYLWPCVSLVSFYRAPSWSPSTCRNPSAINCSTVLTHVHL